MLEHIERKLFSKKYIKYYEVAITALILISVIVIALETVSELYYQYRTYFFWFEIFVLFVFTLEFLLRLYFSKDKKSYIFSFYGFIDVISLVPIYAYLFVASVFDSSFLIFRVLRLLRLFRIIKVSEYYQKHFEILYDAIKYAFPRIVAVFYVLSIIILAAGTLMYIVEGPESGFENIPISVYWAIVTITTVGYGDIVPQTFLGKIITSLLMIVGYSTILVASGIISVGLYKHKERKKKVRKKS